MILDIFLSAPGLLLAAFFGSLIQRIAGMGFGLILSGFLLAIYDPFTAVYVGAFMGLGVTVATMVQLWDHLQWKVVWPVIPPVLIFMSVGYALSFAHGETAWVRILFQSFGLLVIVFAGITLAGRASLANSSLLARPWIGGSATGFMSGTIGIPGPTIAPYFFRRGIVGTAFTASICPLFLLASTSRIALGSGASFDTNDLHIAVFGAVLAVAAVYVGGGLSRFFGPKVQRRLVMALAAAAAARLSVSLVQLVSATYLGL